MDKITESVLKNIIHGYGEYVVSDRVSLDHYLTKVFQRGGLCHYMVITPIFT